MAVFGRKVTLAIGQAGLPGVLFSDLRINFRVKHSRSGTPNTCTVKVWNINPATAAILEGPAPTIILSVGYGDPLSPPDVETSIPRQIFAGDVIKDGLKISRAGPDRIMEIQAQDGGLAYQTGFVTLAFPTSVTMSSVIATIAAQLLLVVTPGAIVVAPDVVLTQGVTFSGSARSILDRFAASVNANWWISDGAFFFLPEGAPAPGLAPLFSSLAGNLIGTPVKKDRSTVEVVALLDAGLRPGVPFILQSNSVNGTYNAVDVQFAGDTGFDTPFYVTAIGKLPGV